MKTKSVQDYLKSLTNKELQSLKDSGLYDEFKMPDLKDKIDKELQQRQEMAKTWQDR